MRNLKIENLPNNKQWIDRDEIMLHACFQILEDFIIKEKGLEAWSSQKKIVKEMEMLNDWWQVRKLNNEDESKDDKMLTKLIKIRSYLWT